MDIIMGGRQTGRTTLMLQAAGAAKEQGERICILVHSHAEKDRLLRENVDWLSQEDVQCWADTPGRGRRSMTIDKRYVDNLDIFLNYHLGPLTLATMDPARIKVMEPLHPRPSLRAFSDKELLAEVDSRLRR